MQCIRRQRRMHAVAVRHRVRRVRGPRFCDGVEVIITHVLPQRCAEQVASVVGQGVGAPLKLAGVTPEAHTGGRSWSSAAHVLEIKRVARTSTPTAQGLTGPYMVLETIARGCLRCHAAKEQHVNRRLKLGFG